MLHILNTTIRRVICHCEIRDCSVQHGAVLCNVRMFCVNGAVARIFTEHLYQMLTFSQQVHACVSKLVFNDNFGGGGGGGDMQSRGWLWASFKPLHTMPLDRDLNSGRTGERSGNWFMCRTQTGVTAIHDVNSTGGSRDKAHRHTFVEAACSRALKVMVIASQKIVYCKYKSN